MRLAFVFIVVSVFTFGSSLFQPAHAGQVIDRIKTNGELVLGTPGDFPPFSVTSDQGDLIGFDISLARELAKSMNVNLRIDRLPFHELIPNLESGKVDMIMSGLSITPRRNMQIAFVGPYGNSGQAFFGKDDIVASLSQPLDLNREGLKIAVLQETTAELTVRAVLPKAEPIFTQSLDQALIKLLNNEIDGIISDYPFCKVSEFRYRDRGFSVYEKILSYEQLGIGVSAEDPLFINLLTNYLNLLVGSGALKAMQEFWFKSSDWIPNLPDLTILKDF